MKYRNRITGLVVSTERQLGPPYEPIDFEPPSPYDDESFDEEE